MAGDRLLLIGSVDNVLRPILIGRRTRMPDFLVLVATLGGLASFGFNGLLIGPLAAALFMSAWQSLGRPPEASCRVTAFTPQSE
jgi:predicted PurR-regulated permease PerM